MWCPGKWLGYINSCETGSVGWHRNKLYSLLSQVMQSRKRGGGGGGGGGHTKNTLECVCLGEGGRVACTYKGKCGYFGTGGNLE